MFLIILSAAGLTAGLSEGGWRSIPQTATQCDYENQKPTWGILSRKVARDKVLHIFVARCYGGFGTASIAVWQMKYEWEAVGTKRTRRKSFGRKRF